MNATSEDLEKRFWSALLPNAGDPDVIQSHELDAMHARQDERMALGVALLDPEKAVEVLALIPAEQCLEPHHGALLRLLSERLQKGLSLDFVEVGIAVAAAPARYGGSAYVSELPEHVPSAALDLKVIADRVRQRYVMRLLWSVGATLIKASSGEPTTLDGEALPEAPDAIASTVALHLSRMAQPTVKTEWTLVQAVNEAVIARQDAALATRPRIVATPNRSVDEILDGGLRAGELVVVAGRPGAGKTAYALGLVAGAADREHKPARVGVISLEMGAYELSDRLLARASGVPLGRIRRGEVDDEPQMEDWREYIGLWPVRIAAPASLTPAGLVTQARRWAARGLDLLVVDYLQLIKHGRAERHDLAVGATATLCKQLARDLGIPVVLLSQLNREVEKRATSKRKPGAGGWWEGLELPRPSDLRDSGQIEQDADVILFPIRAEQFGLDDDPADAALVVAKNRNGRIGVTGLRWDGPTASYRSDTAREDLL